MPRLCALPGRGLTLLFSQVMLPKNILVLLATDFLSRGLGPAWGQLQASCPTLIVSPEVAAVSSVPYPPPTTCFWCQLTPGVGIGARKQLDGDQGRGLPEEVGHAPSSEGLDRPLVSFAQRCFRAALSRAAQRWPVGEAGVGPRQKQGWLASSPASGGSEPLTVQCPD